MLTSVQEGVPWLDTIFGHGSAVLRYLAETYCLFDGAFL